MTKICLKILCVLCRWWVLILYWPALFISTHIPRLPSMQVYGRDVTLHLVAYFILTVSFWVTRYGATRPSLRKRAFYFVVLVLAAYGILDEFTQALVGRSCDIHDWFSDICGILLAMGALFVLRRLWYWLTFYWLAMFAITHWPLAKPLLVLPVCWQQFELVYVMVGYMALTLLFWRSCCKQPKFMINKKIALTTLYILSAYALFDEVSSLFMRLGFDGGQLLSAFTGIVLGIACSAALAQHHLPDDDEA
jgi:VanZ family protein